jgi:phosphoribosylaminoimidazole-succinocarboxamide synthase
VDLALYSGKAKDVTILEDNKVKITYRDSISAFDGIKKDELSRKGETNCQTSSILFDILNRYGFPTHFIEQLNDTQHICKKVDVIPVEIVCRNYAAGSFCKRYGTEKGYKFSKPVIEFFLKDDDLHDPLVNREVAIQMGWCNEKETKLMEAITLAVNKVLIKIFDLISLTLVDFKLEFGKSDDGTILIADEISADTMRLWDLDTGEIKDKDRYRKDLGAVIESYEDILNRLKSIKDLPEIPLSTQASVRIELKKTVLDPAGEVTFRSLKRNQYEGIATVRLGKNAILYFNQIPSSNLQSSIEEISEKILSNPLIEDYSLNIEFNQLEDE